MVDAANVFHFGSGNSYRTKVYISSIPANDHVSYGCGEI